MGIRLGSIVCAILVSWTTFLDAEPPEKYDVLIRYQIVAFRNERVREYYSMAKFLGNAGFVRDKNELINDDEPEDVNHIWLKGTIPAKSALRLPKQEHIQAVLLRPSSEPLPEDGEKLVRVELSLVGGLDITRQRRLHAQTVRVLGSLGFRHADAYDHKGYTRIVGAAPVKSLQQLVSELRTLPAAWSLLSTDTLAAIRKSPQGNALLSKILESWWDYPAGAPLMEKLFTEWEVDPASAPFIAKLPSEVVESDDKRVYKEFLLRHIIASPQSDAALRRLLAAVLKSDAAPEMMKMFLGTVAPQVKAIGLPLLFENEPVVNVVEVLPSTPLPSSSPDVPAVPETLTKLSPDLRAWLADKEAAAKNPVRMEVILSSTPSGDNDDWIRRFNSTKSFVEGRVGPVVTLTGPATDAEAIAKSPTVTGVRFPRLAQIPTSLTEDPILPLLSGLNRRRVVLVASDFRGWEAEVGKGLPKDTSLVDLTRELDQDIVPATYTKPAAVGFGTKAALELAKRAPGVRVTLVRIDPTAVFQLAEVMRFVNGNTALTPSLAVRQYEVDRAGALLRKRKTALLEERKVVLANLEPEGEAAEQRKKYFEAKKQHELDTAKYKERLKRYLKLTGDLANLRNNDAVWCVLSWNVGYARGGISPSSRYLDDAPFSKVWLQSVGTTPAQAWTGIFTDQDRNRYMEFATPDSSNPSDLWTKEYNFLAWESTDGKRELELPAGATIRIAVQWRETQDPYFSRVGDDPYMTPRADLRLALFQQLDPKGETRPTDDLELVASSGGTPIRLQRGRGSSVYEQTLLYTTKKAARYSVRIEGAIPPGYVSADPLATSRAKIFGELRPKMFVQTVSPETGRAIFWSYHGVTKPIGIPGDARKSILRVEKRERGTN